MIKKLGFGSSCHSAGFFFYLKMGFVVFIIVVCFWDKRNGVHGNCYVCFQRKKFQMRFGNVFVCHNGCFEWRSRVFQCHIGGRKKILHSTRQDKFFLIHKKRLFACWAGTNIRWRRDEFRRESLFSSETCSHWKIRGCFVDFQRENVRFTNNYTFDFIACIWALHRAKKNDGTKSLIFS